MLSKIIFLILLNAITLLCPMRIYLLASSRFGEYQSGGAKLLRKDENKTSMWRNVLKDKITIALKLM